MTPTLLLHGALGSKAQFDAIVAQLHNNPKYIALNFPGHGGQGSDGVFSTRLFAESVLAFMEEHGHDEADIFGYSMGGYVGLWLAWQYPERVRSVTTYGTKLEWNPDVASGMSRMFDPEKIEAKAPALAASLAAAHGTTQWKTLCGQTAAFLHDLGAGLGLSAAAYAQISCPVRIIRGDQDHVVSDAESRAVAESIPQGRFEVLPGGKHLIEQVDPKVLAGLLA